MIKVKSSKDLEIVFKEQSLKFEKGEVKEVPHDFFAFAIPASDDKPMEESLSVTEEAVSDSGKSGDESKPVKPAKKGLKEKIFGSKK